MGENNLDNTNSDDAKSLENLCIDFMNEWDRCCKYPDTQEDIERLDDVYNKMYKHIFGIINNKDSK